MTDDLVTRLNKMARCIYIAVEETVADDISDGLTKAAAEITRLKAVIAAKDEALGSIRAHVDVQPSPLAKAIVATCDVALTEATPTEGEGA